MRAHSLGSEAKVAAVELSPELDPRPRGPDATNRRRNIADHPLPLLSPTSPLGLHFASATPRRISTGRVSFFWQESDVELESADLKRVVTLL